MTSGNSYFGCERLTITLCLGERSRCPGTARAANLQPQDDQTQTEERRHICRDEQGNKVNDNI